MDYQSWGFYPRWSDRRGVTLYVLVILSIVYGTTEETRGLAVSSSVSAVGGFRTLAACRAAGQRLLTAPRPPNLELRFSCELSE